MISTKGEYTMTSYNKGDTVSWSWGNGSTTGKIESVSHSKTEIQSKGESITRNGSKKDPAITIKQDDGTKVLKLASELK